MAGDAWAGGGGMEGGGVPGQGSVRGTDTMSPSVGAGGRGGGVAMFRGVGGRGGGATTAAALLEC